MTTTHLTKSSATGIAPRLAMALLLGAATLAACAPAATVVPTIPPTVVLAPTIAPTAVVATEPAGTAVTPFSTQDQVGIYAAVLRQLYGPDDTFGGTFQAPVAYVLRQTDDSAGGAALPTTPPALLPAEVQAGITAAVADLPTQIMWVDDFTAVPRDSQSGAVTGNGAAFRLGSIAPQADGTVQVAGSIYVASLAAGGTTYVLARQAGAWTVTGNTGSQWIS